MSGSNGGNRDPSPRVDVCVVGAGPAGGLVADRLARRGHDVVVLEAGPRFDDASREKRMERSIRPGDEHSTVWGMGGERDTFSSRGERFYPLNHTRVKGVGGSTLHWQGMVMRLHESDFERHSRHGVATDWPISYDDLRPYYAAAETAMGVAGDADNPFAPPRNEPYPLPGFPPSHSDSIFAEACERLGITTHSVPNARNSQPYDGRSACVGYGTCKPVCPSGAKYDGSVHIRKAEDKGVRVIDRAPVQQLEHGPVGETIRAATYATPDGATHRQKARAFVLAAGGVEIPRLLLLSASDQHPNGLANRSGAVGRYFTEHLFAGVGGRIDRPTRQHHIGFNTTESHQFYNDPLRPLGRNGESGNSGRSDRGAIKLEFLNYAGPSPVERALGGEEWGDTLLETLKDAYGTHLAVGALVEQLPRWDNRITLDRSRTDDHGNPVPAIEWGIDDYTRRTLTRANEIQHAILDELNANIEWTTGPGSTGPASHHMGTTRMGENPETSVVNSRLRTHDCTNLWIASSSVFVTSGAMNPTLTIGALALKAADHIDERL